MVEDTFISDVRSALARSGFVPPAVNEVHTIVFESLSLSTRASAAEAVLDAVEVGRARRFRFEQDRTNYTLAHAVWRIALSGCLGMAPVEVPLAAAPSGQPKLPGTRLSTSLSHTAHWVAIAVCHGETVGVDIEQAPSRVRLADLIDTICTPAEAARFAQLPATERETTLLTLWARKEALLKAFGVGLAADLATIPAATDDLVAPPFMAGRLPACRVDSLDLPPGLIGALAAPAGILRTGQHHLEWD